MSENVDQEVAITDEDDDTLLDLETLNDMDMNEVEAAPEFINQPPLGIYHLSVTAKSEKRKDKKTGKTKLIMRHIYSIQDPPPELDNKNELIPARGSMISETFEMGRDAEGMKYWKTRCISIIGNIDGAKVGDVVKELNENGGVFKAKVGTRESTGEDKKTYYNASIQVIKGSNASDGPTTANDVSKL